MRLSKKSEYGLRALIELTKAYDQSALRRSDIAESQQIPVGFLETILLELKRAGILGSRPGVQGGYRLIKTPGRRVTRTGYSYFRRSPRTDCLCESDRLSNVSGLSVFRRPGMSDSKRDVRGQERHCQRVGPVYVESLLRPRSESSPPEIFETPKGQHPRSIRSGLWIHIFGAWSKASVGGSWRPW